MHRLADRLVIGWPRSATTACSGSSRLTSPNLVQPGRPKAVSSTAVDGCSRLLNDAGRQCTGIREQAACAAHAHAATKHRLVHQPPSSCVQNASRVQRQQQHKNKDIQRHLARARIAPPASQSVRSRQRVASHDARFAERMIPSVDIISSLAIDCMLEEMSKSNHSAALSPPCSPARLFPDGRSNRPGPLFFTPSRQGCMRSRAPTRFWFWDVTRTGKAHAIRSLNIAHPQLVFFCFFFSSPPQELDTSSSHTFVPCPVLVLCWSSHTYIT